MPQRIATQLVHAGSRRVEGAVVNPIFQSANFLQEGAQSYGDVRYLRLSNSPQQRGLAQRLATIEQADAALPFASGMAAISTALLSVLRAGDHLLIQRNVYGGTATLLSDLERLGITHTRIDSTDDADWGAACTPNTRAMYVEAISNPLLEVPQLDRVVAFARERGLVSIIDATFASPVAFRPVPFGFDLVVHSATKYLNGHSDVVAGVVAGSQARIEAVLHLQHHLGGSLDAHACFLLERGLKTLALRVPRQSATALRLAKALSEHPDVASVRYPGLPDDPSHGRAERWFTYFGGMLTFETRDDASAERFLDRVQIPLNAASLGGVESLVVRPARSSHMGMSPTERQALGISDRLVRMSVGIEDEDDLVEDVLQALG